ncbi:hypothetical protein P7K49_005065 [Saguinus oedipus]|uniref:Uncharacterized protein n=1 Tax=Saguinus oedipus TaxID=9490 RepID=A0ABQ9WBN4_SAGOE|nr:hypothetical protein P7K49_005065 [Saguinus oedipus]
MRTGTLCHLAIMAGGWKSLLPGFHYQSVVPNGIDFARQGDGPASALYGPEEGALNIVDGKELNIHGSQIAIRRVDVDHNAMNSCKCSLLKSPA